VTATSAASVRSADGTAIAFWRDGAGPPLVLVHGTASDHTRWAATARTLSSSFTTHAIDRRGRGESGDGEPYELGREAEDVVAVIDEIGEPVTLLGHSYGGICALEAALMSDRVERLVLYEPPVPAGVEAYPPAAVERLEALLAAGDHEALLIAFLTDLVRVSPRELGLIRPLPSWPARVAAAPTIVREVHAAEGYRVPGERLRDWGTPTLLLVGGDSMPFFRAAVQAVHEALPGSSVHVLAGQQHVAMDTAPELFAQEIAEFAAA
jgi:pimeloyl-ACP methyl ester carboxylesterase